MEHLIGKNACPKCQTKKFTKSLEELRIKVCDKMCNARYSNNCNANHCWLKHEIQEIKDELK